MCGPVRKFLLNTSLRQRTYQTEQTIRNYSGIELTAGWQYIYDLEH